MDIFNIMNNDDVLNAVVESGVSEHNSGYVVEETSNALITGVEAGVLEHDSGGY